jgi:hypothetical protein
MSVYDAVAERIKEFTPNNTLSHGSILSFPDRGPWGNSRYRGNCSGHVYKRIFGYLLRSPKSLSDLFSSFSEDELRGVGHAGDIMKW